MRWLTYFILAYIALGVQVGLGDYVSYKGATPNFVLIAAIFIALNAPRDSALLGCFGLGVMHDLLTQQQPGLFALAYGLTALIAVGAHHVVYRQHPLTHFSMALAGGIVVAITLLLHSWIHPPGPAMTRWIGGSGKTSATQVSVAAVYLSPATEFTRAVYTAVLAPIVLGLLQRARRPFAFRPPRRKLGDRN
jgi:rod shape-determining protein MreD